MFAEFGWRRIMQLETPDDPKSAASCEKFVGTYLYLVPNTTVSFVSLPYVDYTRMAQNYNGDEISQVFRRVVNVRPEPRILHICVFVRTLTPTWFVFAHEAGLLHPPFFWVPTFGGAGAFGGGKTNAASIHVSIQTLDTLRSEAPENLAWRVERVREMVAVCSMPDHPCKSKFRMPQVFAGLVSMGISKDSGRAFPSSAFAKWVPQWMHGCNMACR